MVFARITLRILRCHHPFNSSVKSAYRRYIRWTKMEIDATFVRDGLNNLHQLWDKYNITMDVELSYVKRVVPQQTQMEALIALSIATKKAVAALVESLLARPLQTFGNG